MYACIYEHRKNWRGTGGRVDGKSKVLQEVLADLKNNSISQSAISPGTPVTTTTSSISLDTRTRPPDLSGNHCFHQLLTLREIFAKMMTRLQGTRMFCFSPVSLAVEASWGPKDGSTSLFQGANLCFQLHNHLPYPHSLCACLAFLVLVCCLVCRSCPLARWDI